MGFIIGGAPTSLLATLKCMCFTLLIGKSGKTADQLANGDEDKANLPVIDYEEGEGLGVLGLGLVQAISQTTKTEVKMSEAEEQDLHAFLVIQNVANEQAEALATPEAEEERKADTAEDIVDE